MAWLEERSGRFHVNFRFGDRKLKKSLGKADRLQAERLLARLEENLSLIDRGLLVLPDGAEVATFLTDGRAGNRKPAAPKPLSLEQCCDDWEAALPDRSMEENSLATVRIHFKHLKRILGAELGATQPFRSLSLDHLQTYVEKRSQDSGHRGDPISPTTIRKELASLRVVWYWARERGHVSGSFPTRGLRFPKTEEKQPFRTWDEIQRQIRREGLSDDEVAALWDCLFLRLDEIERLLTVVEEEAKHGFIFPMFAAAAHTGARRSELIRSEIDDLDLDGATLRIREKETPPG